jgi:hypothetical protein
MDGGVEAKEMSYTDDDDLGAQVVHTHTIDEPPRSLPGGYG